MRYLNRYQLEKSFGSIVPNAWDLIIITLMLGALAAIAWGTSQMTAPYQVGDPVAISLSPWQLPRYALNTVLRMFIALLFSLLCTFTLAPLAAKSRPAEKFVLPFIDVMQSIPVLGFLAITTVGFINLFPNSFLGPECAAIFAIFTAQVWNMTLSLYQSLRSVPKDLQEAARVYRLTPWQQFWRIEVPYSTPGLLWNTMMSMSAGWFFVVLSEVIEVNGQQIILPGIGSYIDKAILESNMAAIGYAILTMLVVILLYDQLLFRPLLAWSEKFRSEIKEEDSIYESWFFDLLNKTRVLKLTDIVFTSITDFLITLPSRLQNTPLVRSPRIKNSFSRFSVLFWNGLIIGSIVVACVLVVHTLYDQVSIQETLDVVLLGLCTALKVICLIAVASLIWIPVGVWIGLHPKASAFFQPLIQFLAAFPANFFYPLVVWAILKYNMNPEIWTLPLMILGTQWYLLFNVIAGVRNIPKELKLAAENFRVRGWLWWKRLILPAIFPFYITGAMATAGGCWNASIVAEYVKWGDNTIVATGLGSYIATSTQAGDFPRLALGISVMCLFVMLFNRLLWQKLYDLSEKRFSLE